MAQKNIEKLYELYLLELLFPINEGELYAM